MILKPATPPAQPSSAVEFGVVAELLDLAATLVRARGELGDTSTRDKRPRIRHAIDRAAHLTNTGDVEVSRRWAALLAAEHVNLASGRGRHRDHLNLPASERTLDGFGLDVGTIGAVNLAADLLGEAAATARLITTAEPIDAHGHGPVAAYRLDGVTAEAVDIDDLLPVNLGGDSREVHARVRDIRVDHHRGVRVFTLDLASPDEATLTITAGHGWRGNLHRPAPHLPLPWRTRACSPT